MSVYDNLYNSMHRPALTPGPCVRPSDELTLSLGLAPLWPPCRQLPPFVRVDRPLAKIGFAQAYWGPTVNQKFARQPQPRIPSFLSWNDHVSVLATDTPEGIDVKSFVPSLFLPTSLTTVGGENLATYSEPGEYRAHGATWCLHRN